jgi:hypothetical protein
VTRHGAGGHRVHGRFQQAEGPSVLCAGLTAPGTVPVSVVLDVAKANRHRQATQGIATAGSLKSHLMVLATPGNI